MRTTRLAGAPALAIPLVVGCGLVLALTGCGSSAPAGGTSSSAAIASSAATASTSAAAAGAVDACALVPAAELKAAIGRDPGNGVAKHGGGTLTQCTWKLSDTASVIAQYSPDAGAYLPDSLYKKPAGASALTGTTRGWASAATHTILAVKGDRGVLLTDLEIGGKAFDAESWTALGNAIAAKL